MAPKMTKELRPIDRSKHLQPGESFIIYYTNSGIGSRKDLWLGIIYPESMMPTMLQRRRHKDAKPAIGEWNVPVEERAHGVYFPGKNNYQWTEKKNMFLVEARPPSILSCTLRADSRLFLDLHKLARSHKDADFWLQMAADERKIKGKLSRMPSLVMPAKRNVQSPSKIPDQDINSSPKQHAKSNEKNGNDLPVPKRARVEEDSRKSDVEASDVDTSPRTPDKTPENDVGAKRPPVPSAGISEGTMPTGYRVYTSAATQTVPESMSRRSGDDIVDIYIGSGADHGIFQLPLKTISMCRFLQSYVNEKDTTFIFHPDLHKLPASEFEPIHSFLATGEFDPRLIDRSESIQPGEQPSILGDQFGFGQKFMLGDINSTEDLSTQILRFGRIYFNAKIFGLTVLQGLALWKLQAAWNSYAGLHHLAPIIQVSRIAFGNCKDSASSIASDPMQSWIVGFFADVMDLFFHSCPEQFWQVMGVNHALQAAVCKRRAEMLARNPGRYLSPDELIASRESSRFPQPG